MNTDVAKTINRTITDYVVFYSEFLAFEQGKLETVEKNRLEVLDDMVKQEEVYLLKSRGMEQNRIDFQVQNGYADKKLKDLILLAPKEMQEEMKTSFIQLNEIVNEIQRVNEHCNIAIKTRLQAIQRSMDRIKSEGSQRTYDDTANSLRDGKVFFSDKA